MKALVALTAVCLFASPALAQTNLEPDTSAFAAEPRDYVPDVATPIVKVFKDAFTPDVRIRAIVLPAIQPRYALGLKQRNGMYLAFAIKSTMVGNGIAAVCEAPVDRQTAEQLIEVWRQMLIRTSYKQGYRRTDVFLDGADYHFSLASYPSDGGMAPTTKLYGDMEGHIFNPNRDSEPGALTNIAHELADYCWTKDRKHLAQANQMTSDLLKRLKAGN